jgi:hypothetical protein
MTMIGLLGGASISRLLIRTAMAASRPYSSFDTFEASPRGRRSICPTRLRRGTDTHSGEYLTGEADAARGRSVARDISLTGGLLRAACFAQFADYKVNRSNDPGIDYPAKAL